MDKEAEERTLWVRRHEGRWLSSILLDRHLHTLGARVDRSGMMTEVVPVKLEHDIDIEPIENCIHAMGWVVVDDYQPTLRHCGFCNGRGYESRMEFDRSFYSQTVSELLGSGHNRIEVYKIKKRTCPSCHGKGEIYN